MSFLYWLEGLRFPLLTDFMLLITHLGEKVAFLAVALVLFWCIDKRHGYYILMVGFVGTLFNQFLKLCFRIPRPWERVSDFTAVEAAKEEATGFSFPSGHTQNSVGTFGGIAFHTNKRWVRWLFISLCILIPISRMYLGVHTPADVLVSFALAIVLIISIYPVVYGGNFRKRMRIALFSMVGMNIGYLLFVHLYPFPQDLNAERLASGFEAGYTLLGALAGMIVVFFVDEYWLHFPVKAKWWAQILKTALGLGVVLAVMLGLEEPICNLLGLYAGMAVHYFIVVLVAGVVWPMTFRFFAKLGVKEPCK